MKYRNTFNAFLLELCVIVLSSNEKNRRVVEVNLLSCFAANSVAHANRTIINRGLQKHFHTKSSNLKVT